MPNTTKIAIYDEGGHLCAIRDDWCVEELCELQKICDYQNRTMFFVESLTDNDTPKFINNDVLKTATIYI